ncbi:hypothetical protein BDFB_013367, partial [Asbolus verrucosus]
MLEFDNLCEEKILNNVKLQRVILQRMGSFSSTPKILNDDNQDNDIQMPINISRFELIQYCQTQPQVHPMVKRAFRKAGEPKDNMYGFKYRKLNAVTKALGQMNDNFVKCPDEALEWNSRKFRIIEEIVEYCPDIICLQ